MQVDRISRRQFMTLLGGATAATPPTRAYISQQLTLSELSFTL